MKLPGETIYTQSTLLQSGVSYKFFVVAVNEVGQSQRSELIQIKAANQPSKITEIAIKYQSMFRIIIEWSPAHDGGDPITDYKVYWDNAEGLTFTSIADSTNGQSNLIRSLALDGSDFGKSYYFKICAVNGLGEGETSDPFLVVAATKPDAPIQLKRDDYLSSREIIAFSWSQGSGNGGSSIIDYRVSFDQGVGIWTVIGDTFTQTHFTSTVLQNIQTGKIYQVYVEARNAIGYSVQSETLTLIAATAPSAPINVQTKN